jgi:hypothetical protein
MGNRIERAAIARNLADEDERALLQMHRMELHRACAVFRSAVPTHNDKGLK